MRLVQLVDFAAVTIAVALVSSTLCGCQDNQPDTTGRPQPLPAEVEQTAQTSVEPADSQPTPMAPQPGEFMDVVPPTRAPLEIDLSCVAVAEPPTVDGIADDAAWREAPEVVTLDRSSQREIRIRAVHTNEEIVLLAVWPDAAPSRTHRSWVWDAAEGVYKQGPDREDALVVKWSMDGNDAHLAIHDGNARPHRADVWFWKACRTDPAGYADDKIDILTEETEKGSCEIAKTDGGVLYLTRHGDAGEGAYKERFVFDFAGAVSPRFEQHTPEGSRADVCAKGHWEGGYWTVEFRRRLQTGHDDDLAFAAGKTYLFGIACYEMACDVVHPEWTQPLYRTGDVFDRLLLVLTP